MTRVPLVSDSATFSAASRQIEQREEQRVAVLPLVRLPVERARRGRDGEVRDGSTGGVKRSSGSSVRLPTTVMTVSPAMASSSFAIVEVRRVLTGQRGGDLGPQDGLVEVELAVELLDASRASAVRSTTA